MNREILERMIIEHIEGSLNERDSRVLAEELEQNPEAEKLYRQFKEVMQIMDQIQPINPPANMVFNAIEVNIRKKRDGVSLLYRIAAAVTLLVIGGSIGYFISKDTDDKHARVDSETQSKAYMLAKLTDEHSALQRLSAVNQADQMVEVDEELRHALEKTLNTDPNTNVRLAALEVLMKFRSDPAIREVLVRSLPDQVDPVVQINLIKAIVEMNDKKAIPSLQQIINQEDILQEVKDEAHAGIFKLS